MDRKEGNIYVSGSGKSYYVVKRGCVQPLQHSIYILVIARSQICLMPYIVILCEDIFYQFGQELFILPLLIGASCEVQGFL